MPDRSGGSDYARLSRAVRQAGLMDRRRGEQKNWYQLPMAERQRQMQDHGAIGRRYAAQTPLSAALFQSDDGNEAQLVWNRRKAKGTTK